MSATYKGPRKSKTNTRERAFTLDYLVKKLEVGNRVIDIVAEGSSMARNYNDQFHKMLTNPAQGQI
ncbi:MAG: ABC transporter substrate-binding protein [Polyangiaceae bacterium]|nr:ABC transporter substrate-binding protein [Polyangiaceae bacterium]